MDFERPQASISGYERSPRAACPHRRGWQHQPGLWTVAPEESPAVLGALLTTTAVDTLPGHLADAGVGPAARERVVAAADSGGLGAVAQLDEPTLYAAALSHSAA
ncbi:hypothetical protein [Streptomyces lutosisoli]|uniref:Uncharacterized protein n=1 Tax=Streptomyces lutosisoli TaxID=2665721 RepID=A0ABW2V6L8_9ACTN